MNFKSMTVARTKAKTCAKNIFIKIYLQPALIKAVNYD